MVMTEAFVGSACTGGCYHEVESVRVSPSTPCLDLFGGHSRSDPGICGAPDLHGTNDCAEPLTLPPTHTGGESKTIMPGEEIFYSLDGDAPPGIDKRGNNEAFSYVIRATLGDQDITITVSVHED
jgi:hypothetical protein